MWIVLIADIVIKNGRIMLPSKELVSASIVIEDGKIASICSEALTPQADRVIDADGLLVFPGIIDPHTHLGFYNQIEEDFATETASASVGGVTTIINYFRAEGSYKDTFPSAKDAAARSSMIDFSFHLGLINNTQIDELEEYVNRFGISSFKLYLDYKVTGVPVSSAEFSIDDGFVYRALEKIAQIGGNVKACAHCENAEIIRDMTARVAKTDRGLEGWAKARPGFAEAENLKRVLYFSALTNAKIHIVHISASESVEILREAKNQGSKFDAETQIHYLTQTKDSPAGILAKVKPPIRGRKDMEEIWSAVNEGLISTISSDHVPNIKTQKIGRGDVWSALAGFPGSPLVLPLLLSEGVRKGRIGLDKVLETTSYNTARIFNLFPKKGMINVGSDADLTIVDLKKEKKVTPELLKSRSDYTIYEGWILRGWPVMTLVRGAVVSEEGEVVGKRGWGQYHYRYTEKTNHQEP